MAAGWGVDRDSASGTSNPLSVDHGLLAGLSDDDHAQYLLASAATSRAAFAANWADLTDAGATTLHKHDHGGQDGLSDDDHTQYALLAGRSGGQTLIGGTASGENLTLQSTSHATRGAISVSDKLIAAAALATTGVLSPSQITSNQDDYDPTGLSTATVLRLSSDASRNITGLAGGAAGRIVIIHNVGSNNIVLKDETTSTAANRFALTADVTLSADSVAVLQYDSTSSRWRAVSGGGGSSASGSAMTLAVSQSSHGFAVGDVLYHNGTIYAKADADAASTADVVGIVSVVGGTDDFTLHIGGAITTLSGLTAGTVYFLSGTAGAYTSTEPSTVGQISKPLMVAYSTTAAFWINLRGSVVGSASSSFAVSQASGDGSTTAFSLPATPVHENNVFVTISGVAQHKDTFSVSGSTITFSTAPPSGTSNIEFCVVGAVSIGTPSDGTVSNAKLAAGALFTAAAEQASTSGTAIDFTGIPSGTQMIVVMFDGVSVNGTSGIAVQLGDSGGVENTGYATEDGQVRDSASPFINTDTTLFRVGGSGVAADLIYGSVTLVLQDSANNTWCAAWNIGQTSAGTAYVHVGGGRKATSAVLDRVRITSGNPDTFDAGAISIMYR